MLCLYDHAQRCFQLCGNFGGGLIVEHERFPCGRREVRFHQGQQFLDYVAVVILVPLLRERAGGIGQLRQRRGDNEIALGRTRKSFRGPEKSLPVRATNGRRTILAHFLARVRSQY